MSRLHWSDVERSLHKLTKKDVTVFKPKHVHIVTDATYQRDIPTSEMIRTLVLRIREGHWAIAFKSLIVMHILMRDGDSERVLTAMKNHSQYLDLDGFRDRSVTPIGVMQSKNIRTFAAYLREKTKAGETIGKDLLSVKDDTISRYKKSKITEFFKEISALQSQMQTLLSCSWTLEDMDNVISLQAFRLLIADLMSLFHLINEAILRILECIFEMSKADATNALSIYKLFCEQAPKVSEMFDVAKKLKYELGIDVPDFKVPPTALAKTLEDYVNSSDFELQRQYNMQKKNVPLAAEKPVQKEQKSPLAAKKDFDFFASIDHTSNNYDSSKNNFQTQNPNVGNMYFGDPFAVNVSTLQQTQVPNRGIALQQKASVQNPFADLDPFQNTSVHQQQPQAKPARGGIQQLYYSNGASDVNQAAPTTIYSNNYSFANNPQYINPFGQQGVHSAQMAQNVYNTHNGYNPQPGYGMDQQQFNPFQQNSTQQSQNQYQSAFNPFQ